MKLFFETYFLKKSGWKKLFLPAVLILCLSTCRQDQRIESPDRVEAFRVAMQWNETLLKLNRFSEGYRPPVSAQLFAYAGIAAWESALPGLPEIRSCSEEFSGLELPEWDTEKQQTFILPAALNAAYAVVARRFFPHAPLFMKEHCRRNISEIESDLYDKYPQESIAVSKQFGEAVGEAVYEWAAGDSIGHQAYLYNYDRNYQPPQGNGYWKPSVFEPLPALLPKWGKARTFVVGTDQVKITPPLKFSENPGSPFFAQALEVYSLSRPLTKENHWIAEFWSDDVPGLTFSASARWIAIANQALHNTRSGIVTSLETWLKVGLALNDSAVKTWEGKYAFAVERPEQYIRRNINPNWEPLHHSPPFPSYPSGHSAFGGAASAVLSAILGDDFFIEDHCHEERKEFQGKPRYFYSFSEMADENAFSRLLLGVHFRMDCEEGLRVGRLVGKKVADLELIRKKGLVSRN